MTAALQWKSRHMCGWGTVHTAGPYLIRHHYGTRAPILVDYSLDPPAWHHVTSVHAAKELAATTPDPTCPNHGHMTLWDVSHFDAVPAGPVWLCLDHTAGCPLHRIPADLAAHLSTWAARLHYGTSAAVTS